MDDVDEDGWGQVDSERMTMQRKEVLKRWNPWRKNEEMKQGREKEWKENKQKNSNTQNEEERTDDSNLERHKAKERKA